MGLEALQVLYTCCFRPILVVAGGRSLVGIDMRALGRCHWWCLFVKRLESPQWAKSKSLLRAAQVRMLRQPASVHLASLEVLEEGNEAEARGRHHSVSVGFPLWRIVVAY